MEIKRKIYQNLCEWKKSANGTKALMIEGARRIGKSTVAEEFGKKGAVKNSRQKERLQVTEKGMLAVVFVV